VTEHESRRVRRARWFAALVAVPAVLAGLALVWPGRQMSDDLRHPSEQALDAAGLAGTVTADAAQADPVPAAPTAAQPTPGKGDALAPAERERLVAQLAEVLSAAPIVFGPDTADLPGPSAASVQRMAELLVAVPAAPVLVEGHVADTPGSVEVEQRLSERRAVVVAEALEAAGVDRSRITTRGRGAELPLATPALSRRAEISIQ
jgi:outer membrane protein OmpA-like peptidoglycan-associated protein